MCTCLFCMWKNNANIRFKLNIYLPYYFRKFLRSLTKLIYVIIKTLEIRIMKLWKLGYKINN